METLATQANDLALSPLPKGGPFLGFWYMKG